MDDILLNVRDLNFSTDDKVLLSNINFSVAKGEKFAVLGPNGAGKSLLVDCLLGNLDYEKGGQITAFGTKLSKQRHRIGVLYEVFATFPLLKVKEVVDLMRSIYRVGADDSYADSLYASLKINELEEKLFIVMSKGERQRVGIFAAMFFRPELIIFDEPTSGLDPIMQEIFWKIVARSEATILYISHHWKEVTKEADRVIFLNQGELLTDPISPADLLAKLPYRRKIVVEKHPALLTFSTTETIIEDDESLAFLFTDDADKSRLLREIGRYTTSYSLFDLDLKDAFKYLTHQAHSKTSRHESNGIQQAI